MNAWTKRPSVYAHTGTLALQARWEMISALLASKPAGMFEAVERQLSDIECELIRRNAVPKWERAS